MTPRDRWRPAGGLKLEPNAEIAARETTRSLALTAGPGAGKTEMLAQKADFLLRTGACRYPWRILAISFKVDASRNLRLRVLQRCGYQLASRFDSYTFHAFANQLIGRFRPVLVGADALDPDYTVGNPRVQHRQIEFADMVPLAVQIIQNCEVARNAVRHTYSHVFLDEFQDCTSQQYELIKTAFSGSDAALTAVGDTKQRIMGWAGALEGVFEVFAEDFRARPLNLYQNFRSLPRLRRMQNAMVKAMDPPAAVPDDEITGSGGTVEILSFESDRDEARGVADLVEQWLREESLPASEVAILVSKQLDLYSRPLMTELDGRGLAYRNEEALQNLSAEPLTRLVVDFLLVVVGDNEPDAYARLMDVLRVSAHDEMTAYKVQARWHDYIASVHARLRGHGIPPNSKLLRNISIRFLKRIPPEILVGLSSDYEHVGRIPQLVDETFDRIAELLAVDPEPAAALKRFAEDNAVRIMTIHKSKGLEFDTVVVLGVEHQTFWGKPDDERAAYFVGISRAKRQLVLTTVQVRLRPDGHTARWDVRRTPQEEFLRYAMTAE